MAVVVSDASPLICLAAIRRFDLLHLLYGEVLIPEAVWLEMPATWAGCKSPGRQIVPSSRSSKRRSIAAKQRRLPWL
jgi:predicted nucleic acid-binding protein